MSRNKVKTHVIHARLSQEENLRFRMFCDENGLTASETLRRMAREAGGFGPTFDGETRNAVLDYAKQLRAIGVNINQIARILNSGRAPDYATLQAGIGRLTQELIAQDEDYASLCARARKRAKRQVTIDHG